MENELTKVSGKRESIDTPVINNEDTAILLLYFEYLIYSRMSRAFCPPLHP